MKVLQIIHGFPPHYMAGSEVYTYNLTKELLKSVDVSVFTRIENPYEKPYAFVDETFEGICIRRVNKPQRDYTLKDKYLDEKMDQAFRDYIKAYQPDIVHFGHLSHLSTNLINIAKEEFNLPVIYTIHDFWLFCFRGQFIDPKMNLCPEYSIENCYDCAKKTFKEYATMEDVNEYRNHMLRVINNIDLFLSPSHYLRNFFIKNGIDEQKVIYSKYGFDKNVIQFKTKHYVKGDNINFGFIGRVISVKGIRLLLEAFGELGLQKNRLLIFGNIGKDEVFLRMYANENVDFMGGYKNGEINEVLDGVDVLVVPSVWYENSPLVIQEAFLAGIPVITSNKGGMAELVENGVDGFTFELGNKDALKRQMETIALDPTILNEMKIDRNKVRSIEDDARSVLEIYRGVIR